MAELVRLAGSSCAGGHTEGFIWGLDIISATIISERQKKTLDLFKRNIARGVKFKVVVVESQGCFEIIVGEITAKSPHKG